MDLGALTSSLIGGILKKLYVHLVPTALPVVAISLSNTFIDAS